MDETMNQIQSFLKRRNIVNSKLDTEIHSRISKAYETMETLEKGVKTFDDTLKAAKGRVNAAVGKKIQPKIATLSSNSVLGNKKLE